MEDKILKCQLKLWENKCSMGFQNIEEMDYICNVLRVYLKCISKEYFSVQDLINIKNDVLVFDVCFCYYGPKDSKELYLNRVFNKEELIRSLKIRNGREVECASMYNIEILLPSPMYKLSVSSDYEEAYYSLKKEHDDILDAMMYRPGYMISKEELKLKLNEKYGFCTAKFGIEKVIFNPPATIVFWGDGSKTVVKCGPDDEFNPHVGIAMCVMKKVYGDKYVNGPNNEKVHAWNYHGIFRKWADPWLKKQEEDAYTPFAAPDILTKDLPKRMHDFFINSWYKNLKNFEAASEDQKAEDDKEE